MTSDTDDTTGRRPPTIELAATEVEGAAEKAAAGEAGAPASSNASEAGRSGRRLTSHIGSALLGAVLMAAAAVALWFFGAIPSREAAPVTQLGPDGDDDPVDPLPGPMGAHLQFERVGRAPMALQRICDLTALEKQAPAVEREVGALAVHGDFA